MTSKAQVVKEKLDNGDSINSSFEFQSTLSRKWKDNPRERRKILADYVTAERLVSRIHNKYVEFNILGALSLS